MAMREECRHFQSRTYPNGEVARFCVLDMAPDAPWRCPDNCALYEKRLADVGWTHGKLVEPALEPEPTGADAAGAADLLADAEAIVSAAAPDAVAEARKNEHKQSKKAGGASAGGSRRWRKRKGSPPGQ